MTLLKGNYADLLSAFSVHRLTIPPQSEIFSIIFKFSYCLLEGLNCRLNSFNYLPNTPKMKMITGSYDLSSSVNTLSINPKIPILKRRFCDAVINFISGKRLRKKFKSASS